jgi:hypothetical protein
MGTTIVRIAFPIIVFVMLYIVAFVSNRHCRDSDNVLFVSRSQWEGIFVSMLPVLLAIFMR